jgi:hypothetical protein
MPDDTEAAALRARLKTIIKEAEDAEAQAIATRRRVQAATSSSRRRSPRPPP